MKCVKCGVVLGNDRSSLSWQQINPLVRFFTLPAPWGVPEGNWRRSQGREGGVDGDYSDSLSLSLWFFTSVPLLLGCGVSAVMQRSRFSGKPCWALAPSVFTCGSFLKPRWEKKVLRELEVGNAPVFVAFGLLLPFFSCREKSVPLWGTSKKWSTWWDNHTQMHQPSSAGWFKKTKKKHTCAHLKVQDLRGLCGRSCSQLYFHPLQILCCCSCTLSLCWQEGSQQSLSQPLLCLSLFLSLSFWFPCFSFPHQWNWQPQWTQPCFISLMKYSSLEGKLFGRQTLGNACSCV